MSLLPKETRIKYFKDLGLGEYNEDNILKFQIIAFIAKAEHDRNYGSKTDIALRHWHNVWKTCKNFKPNEFRCPCGKCTGYPTQMRVRELKHIQAIRDHYERPMEITSGLRCEHQNRKVKGSKDSGHLKGLAVDFYLKGVTDSLANRKKTIKYVKGLKNHKYTYGNGWSSIDGYKPNTPGMGNALHTEVR